MLPLRGGRGTPVGLPTHPHFVFYGQLPAAFPVPLSSQDETGGRAAWPGTIAIWGGSATVSTI